MTDQAVSEKTKKSERRRNAIRTNIVYIPLILFLVALSIWLWDSGQELFIPPSETPAPTFDQYPYAVIEAAESQHFNENGELSYTLNAELLRHFRKNMRTPSPNDFMLLDSLEVTLYNDGKPWVLSAKQGRISENGETLSLWDNVTIWQVSDKNGKTELTTTHLTVKPKEKMIMTDAAIKITNPSGEIEAVGMVVNIAQERINLLSEVRAKHAPI